MINDERIPKSDEMTPKVNYKDCFIFASKHEANHAICGKELGRENNKRLKKQETADWRASGEVKLGQGTWSCSELTL